MAEIHQGVNDMGRADNIAFLKSISLDDKKKYNNYMTYQCVERCVLKQRNKDRAK